MDEMFRTGQGLLCPVGSDLYKNWLDKAVPGEVFPLVTVTKEHEKNDGGPAFPVTVSDGGPSGFQSRDFTGITVRDYFAAKVLQGMLSSDSTIDRTKVKKSAWAKVAYEFADAMCAERAK
jgi:hypothetical protein